ncbi:TonB-dependent receptor [Flavobacteriaceae bacterium Ap0902]|nr:TonB-dependent receptor [Flavobacteriaceae bacterium Ap0902]
MKKFLLLCFILCSLFPFAQEQCIYRAMLLDSLNLPVYDASITAFDENDNSAGYTFSDNQGEFKLEMPCGKSYELEIEHLSYEPLVHKVNLDKSKREKIILNQSTVKLQDVIAKGRVPIKMKGDTIEYDADSFKTGEEEDLEDILKKLPGIQVENGKVYYQGKEINSIKVEGREIFGGNTKLLTKNLPSDAVDKIQLNKKFKSNPFANSLQDDEQPELNITLKEDKKNLIFGNITVGGDADQHYDLQEKLFRFSRKTDATLISDFNTFGKEVFDNEDYFQFLGGISEFTEEGGSMALRNSMRNVMFGAGEKATSMKNHLGALHLGYEPNNKMNVTAFALATVNDLNYKSTTERIYPAFTQRDENTNSQNIFSFISRLKIDYNVSPKANIKYRVNFNQQNADNISAITSFLNEDKTPIQFRNSKNKRENSHLLQRLNYIRKVGINDNFGLYLTHSYQKEAPDLRLNSTDALFPTFFDFNPTNDGYILNQKEDLNAHTLQGLAIYNHLITNLSNLRIKLGANYSTQNLENEILDRNQPIVNDFTPADMDFNFTELYADATYTKKFKKLKVDVGAGLHRYKTENKGNRTHSSREITRVLPHLEAEYAFSMSKSLNLNYKQTYEIPQIRELTDAYNIDNYYSIFRGNPDLKETKFHQVDLSYRVFNAFSFFNLWMNASYTKKINNIRMEGLFQDLIQFTTPFNSDMPEDTWAARLYGSKRFSKVYSLKLNATASHSIFASRSNQVNLENTSTLYSATLTNTFKIRKKLEINAGLSYLQNNYKNNFLENEFINLNPFLKSAWVISDKFLFQSEYTFNNQYSNGDNINRNHDLMASLRFKPAKRVYAYLTAGNLLNNNSIVSNSYNDFYTVVNTRETLGRYIIGSLKVKF